MTYSVVCKDLTKKFGAFTAVNNISLAILEGEFVVILGPSGCGKTTLLRMIAGLERPSSGDITIAGRLVTDVSARDRDIAMVFQDYALYPYKSVYDNLAFPLQMRRMPKCDIDQQVRAAAKILAIEKLLDRKPSQLSGGQRQRVALGRAVVRRPKVFLMDEPLSNLDAKLRVEMRSEMHSLHQRLRTTIIYVTHDQTEAMTMGERIVVMRDGVIEQVGTPQDVYNRPSNRFVAEFLGAPKMNVLPVAVSEDALSVRFADMSICLGHEMRDAILRNNLAGCEALLGIRPEHLYPRDPDAVITGGCAASIQGVLTLKEALGHEDLLEVASHGHRIALRAVPDSAPAPGNPVRLDIATQNIVLFDKDGRSVTASSPSTNTLQLELGREE